jgi:hypothetical protein
MTVGLLVNEMLKRRKISTMTDPSQKKTKKNLLRMPMMMKSLITMMLQWNMPMMKVMMKYLQQ